MTGDPLTVLREFENAYCRDARYPECMPLHDALDAVEALIEAAPALYELAAVSWEGDPWYAENADINGEYVLGKARAALARFPATSPAKEQA